MVFKKKIMRNSFTSLFDLFIYFYPTFLAAFIRIPSRVQWQVLPCFCPTFALLLPRFCPAFAPLLPRSSVDMKLPNDQLVPIANWFPSSFSNQFSNWQVAFRRPSSTAACSIWLVHSNPQHLDCFGLFPSLKTSWIASWLQSRTTAAATNCKSNDG